MTNKNFLYEVAFSFLEQDHDLAAKLDNLINRRMPTFIYSKKQTEAVGRDGEELFNRVFSLEARTVFVLYSKVWGKTPWTRIEETAIRNRGYKDGYDFVTFVMLDNTAPPDWLPKYQIWTSFEKWGIEGIAAIVEERVQSSGGSVHQEDALEAIDIQIKHSQSRSEILESQKGVDLSKEEEGKLFREIEAGVSKISSIKLAVSKTDRSFQLRGGGYELIVNWQLNWANSLQYSVLTVRYGELKPIWERQDRDDLRREEYDFDLDIKMEPRWKDRQKKNFLQVGI